MNSTKLVNIALGMVLLMGACGGNEGNGPDGEGDEGPDAPVQGSACTRADVLFAIDASGSMKEEIQAMSGDVFPLFAQELHTIGQGLEDYRIGVIDACPMPASLHTRGASSECDFQGGNVWMESDSTTLTQEFSCVSDLYTADNADYPGGCSGTGDDDERPAWAAYAALTPPFINEANAGFLRDDALLVIVAITDEDEETFAGDITPQEIFDNLVSIKGDLDKMVFLGIAGATTCDTGSYGSALKADTLRAVTEMFIAEQRGVFWDLCTGRLEDGLAEAMAVIEATCNAVVE